MIKQAVLTLLLSVALLSCVNEIPFDVDEKESLLVINALIDAEKAENDIVLALTGRDKVAFLTEAVIKLYVNGELKEEIFSTEDDVPDGDQSVFKTRLVFRPGDQVRMEAATSDHLYSAFAEVTVPYPTEILRVDTGKIPSYSRLRVKATFTDNPGEKNYYRIMVERHFRYVGKSSYTGNDTVVSKVRVDDTQAYEDVVLTDGRPCTVDEFENGSLLNVENLFGVFDDSRINGQYTMTVNIPYNRYIDSQYSEWVRRTGDYYDYRRIIDPVEEETLELKVRILSIGEAEYYYLKALNTYENEYEEGLSEPIRFPTNVEKGTGILGISMGTSQTIPVQLVHQE